MTIQVTIKNDDSRANAVVEILSVSEYVAYSKDSLNPTLRTTTSEGILRGGESKTVYLCADRKLEIIERQNG